MVVDLFLDAATEAIRSDRGDLAVLDRTYVERWLKGVQEEIAEEAKTNESSPRDYACTFLGAIIGDKVSVYFQLGDGAIIVNYVGEEQPHYIFWPQHGEFANSTFFVTQTEAISLIEFKRIEVGHDFAPIQSVAIFSDGLERLILNFAAKTVHAPALNPIFTWLADTDPNDSSEQSPALLAYLNSDHINRRTDDDKTLVMATRATPSKAI